MPATPTLTPSTPSSTSTPGRRARRRTVAVTATALALVLSLGACGTSAGEKATAAPKADKTTTTEVEETTTTTEPEEDDPVLGGDIPVVDPTEPTEDPDPEPGTVSEDEVIELLDHINISIDDLPAGWEAEPSDPDEPGIIDQCSTNAGPDQLLIKVRSDMFSLIDVEAGGGLNLDNGSALMADVDVADALMADLRTDDFAACATDLLLSTDDPSVTVEGVFEPAELDVELGEDVAVLQGQFVMSDSEQSIEVSSLVFTIRTGQIITTLTASAINVPGDDQLLGDLLDTISARQAETA